LRNGFALQRLFARASLFAFAFCKEAATVADPTSIHLIACSSSALEPKVLIVSIVFLAGLIALTTYDSAHHPELWNAITHPTT
jgi:hypothetical protein